MSLPFFFLPTVPPYPNLFESHVHRIVIARPINAKETAAMRLHFCFSTAWPQDSTKQQWESLDILHLLSHLLDQDFHVDGITGHLLVLGFRGQGIGFAVEFLHEEIKPPSDRFLTP